MDIPVFDPLGITRDKKMIFLGQALDPKEMQRCLNRNLITPQGEIKSIQLRAIRVVRYKPERRCLIEYELDVGRDNARDARVTWLGKVRAKGLNPAHFQNLQSLWRNGFSDNSLDGISVAEPVGLIPQFQMWLQRKMPGLTATELLDGSQGIEISARIASAAHKLHRADISTDRIHTIGDEMDILRDRLAVVARLRPGWEKRLSRLLDACNRLAATLRVPAGECIHRDFYSDQVLVDGDRLYLLDLDLICQGDPALDIGNFNGHISEYSLRVLGDPSALADRERALEDRFVELAGEAVRERVRAYALLTLVRHVYLSTQFLERQAFTQDILELCEQRFNPALSAAVATRGWRSG